MSRMWAIVERELRRFRRSPILIVVSMIFPLCQLVILGYAFGGNVKHLKLAIVDQDHGLPAVKIRELAQAVAAGARTVDLIDYADQGQAMTDLRNGRVNGVLTIPPEFSRRVLLKNQPTVALIEDNTDKVVAGALAGSLNSMLVAYNEPPTAERVPAQGGAGCRRGVSVRAVHPVPAARLDRDVDLHDGDDRRRDHLHRRQGARTARGLPGHADHEARADRRIQHVGHDQGRACRTWRSC